MRAVEIVQMKKYVNSEKEALTHSETLMKARPLE